MNMSTLKSPSKINKINNFATFPNQLSQSPSPFPTIDEKAVDTKKKKKTKNKNKTKIKNTVDARKIYFIFMINIGME